MTYEQCKGCPRLHHMHDQIGWWFYGCGHAPYHGKFIAEIKECPKDKEDKQ